MRSGRHDLSDDDRERQLALMMPTHPRLGQRCLLSLPPSDVVAAIARLSLTPIVERPIALHLNFLYLYHKTNQNVYPEDDFVSAFYEGAVLTDPPTPFLCTVLDRGVPVFRAPLRQAAATTPGHGGPLSSMTYYSRRRDDGARVSFAILLAPAVVRHNNNNNELPFAVIFEHQFNHTTSTEELIHQAEAATPAELLAFRARNTLGVELLLLFNPTVAPAWTPIVATSP